jgi:hypothetical protein
LSGLPYLRRTLLARSSPAAQRSQPAALNPAGQSSAAADAARVLRATHRATGQACAQPTYRGSQPVHRVGALAGLEGGHLRQRRVPQWAQGEQGARARRPALPRLSHPAPTQPSPKRRSGAAGAARPAASAPAPWRWPGPRRCLR